MHLKNKRLPLIFRGDQSKMLLWFLPWGLLFAFLSCEVCSYVVLLGNGTFPSLTKKSFREIKLGCDEMNSAPKVKNFLSLLQASGLWIAFITLELSVVLVQKKKQKSDGGSTEIHHNYLKINDTERHQSRLEGVWQRCLLSEVCAYSAAKSCPTLCDPMDSSPPGSSVHWDSPGKNTGEGSHSPLQGIVPTQGSNLSSISYIGWQVLYHWATWEAPEWGARILISLW